MEEENSVAAGCKWGDMSPEIVEIGDDSKSAIGSIDEGIKDVFVAVGRNDLDVVKWALDHVVSRGARVILVHVFPPIAYIPTPVGRLSRSQLSKEQVQIYTKEENNRRRNILQKYIHLCTDAKVMVDTMLIESNATAKAILDLIPVANITTLVMGTKRSPSSWKLKKGMGKGEIVEKNAPDFCDVNIVCDGTKVADGQQKHVTNPVRPAPASYNHQRSGIAKQPERKIFDCICFSGTFD